MKPIITKLLKIILIDSSKFLINFLSGTPTKACAKETAIDASKEIFEDVVNEVETTIQK